MTDMLIIVLDVDPDGFAITDDTAIGSGLHDEAAAAITEALAPFGAVTYITLGVRA